MADSFLQKVVDGWEWYRYSMHIVSIHCYIGIVLMYFMADCLIGVSVVSADDVSGARYVEPFIFPFVVPNSEGEGAIYTYLPGESGNAYAAELGSVFGHTVNQ